MKTFLAFLKPADGDGVVAIVDPGDGILVWESEDRPDLVKLAEANIVFGDAPESAGYPVHWAINRLAALAPGEVTVVGSAVPDGERNYGLPAGGS